MDNQSQENPIKNNDVATEQPNKDKIPQRQNATYKGMKLKKKLAKGISVLCKTENKKFEDITTQNPTKNIFVIHSGNGDEEDYQGITNFLEPFGNFEIHIMPGRPYGFIEFEKAEEATKFIESTQNAPDMTEVKAGEVTFADNKKKMLFFIPTCCNVGQLEKHQDLDVPEASSEDPKIPGLEIIHDFISEEDEKTMMSNIDSQKWLPLAQRRVQHYGYEFVYGTNTVDKTKYMGKYPEFGSPETFKKVQGIAEKHNLTHFDQMTLNEYFPGQGIPPHVDAHSPFDDVVLGISLGSGVVMTWKNDKGVAKHVFLPRRSVFILSGEARYGWYRSIATRRADKVDGKIFFRKRRVSITIRKVRFDPCKCKFPLYCDSQSQTPLPAFEIMKDRMKDTSGLVNNQEEKKVDIKNPTGIVVENEDDKKLSNWEKKYVYQTYDKIAAHFSKTRYKPWPKVESFLNSLEDGSIVIDVGCGNGKYLGIENRERLNLIGTDRCENLLTICRDRIEQCQVFSADSLKLPVRDNSADAAISIAVIHHFSTPALRVQAIEEIARVTRSGGKILIYVWAFEQDGRKCTQQDVLVPWNLQYKFEDDKKLKAKLGDGSSNEKDANNNSKENANNKAIDNSKDSVNKDNSTTTKDANTKNSTEEVKSSDNQKKEGEDDVKLEDEDNEIADVVIHEGKKTLVYKRYYHMFIDKELDDLIKQVSSVEVVDSYYDHANWCVILKKK